MALDQKYSKDEILTRYLNIVYFGEGAYGIEAAAQTYFSVHAKDLTLPQAAMLAGLRAEPVRRRPDRQPGERDRRGATRCSQRMHDARAHHRQQTDRRPSPTPVQVTPGPVAAQRLHQRHDRAASSATTCRAT